MAWSPRFDWSLINENISLGSIQKFHFFKASISGSATKILNSIPVSADNFTLPSLLISENYESKSLLI